MSIIKVGPGNFGRVTIQASPIRSYVSGSAGITGSVFLESRRSLTLKQSEPIQSLTASIFDDDSTRLNFKNYAQTSADAVKNEQPFVGAAEKYLEAVNAASQSPLNNINVDVIRFEPSFDYTNDTGRKLAIVNSMYPAYRVAYPSSQFTYTNYHCLNFFTSSNVPSSAALIYPNSSSVNRTDRISGSYVVDDGFCFEFYIKPQNYMGTKAEYHAGTILHLSSTYAVSLVSGSGRDGKGRADTFRIQLQLSHSADLPPSEAVKGNYPNDLVFQSQDNFLKKNSWHHVAVRWSGNQNNRTGSFLIDNTNRGYFVVPSASIAPKPFASRDNPNALIVGNFYQGSNAGANRQSLFFSERASSRDGLDIMTPEDDVDKPLRPGLHNPLSAELHEIRIFDKYRFDNEIKKGSEQGISKDTSGLIFYLPPFFTRKSPTRKQVGEIGGILTTPFQGINGSTTDPFNISLSFGVGGHYLNLENFTQDFANRRFPRLFDLTASQINNTTTAQSANSFLYHTASVRYHNLFMPPCDNGKFMPYFPAIGEIETGSLPTGRVKSGSFYYKYRDDLDNLNLNMISLRDLLPSSSYKNYFGEFIPKDGDGNDQVRRDESGNIIGDVIVHVGAGFEDTLMGASPENMGLDSGEVLTIFQRTRDDTSNEVVFFDVSNLFYGTRIKPGSVEIIDDSLTGSFGDIKMTLKDDGYGNLYRADATPPHATWNSVGNVFYNEGIVTVKSPNIPLFGKDGFTFNLRGENEVHVFKADVLAQKGMINSSSNPNYQLASASLDANAKDSKFVAITHVNFHDDNLNVIMRSKFAQPVIKRNGDKILFRSKLDF